MAVAAPPASDELPGNTSSDLPPWTAPKFDVRKKPPPVPKPRYTAACAGAARPTPGSDAPDSVPPSPVAALAEKPRLRWGQLGEDPAGGPCTGTRPPSAPEPLPSGTQAMEPSPGPMLPPDYRESWQKWRAMPSFLEEMRQQLQRPAPAPGPAPPPSEEALAFLERLLSGTEPAAAPHRRPVPVARPAETALGTAQVVGAARRLRAQAEAARQRRRTAGSSSVGRSGAASGGDCRAHAASAPRQAPAAATPAPVPVKRPKESERDGDSPPDEGEAEAGGTADATATLSSPAGEPDGDNPPDYELRMQERQREHARRLHELELDAQREQERLLREMEHEQAELSERRRAQDAWQQRLQHETEEQKRTAERESEARLRAEMRNDAAWRSRWWREWHKAEEKSKRKEEEHRQWYQEWWEQFKSPPENEQQEEQDANEWDSCADDDSSNAQGPPPLHLPPPPPPAAARTERADQRRVLGQLCTKRREPLEERKREWRALCLQWHPDKCDDKDASTAMFQYLQGLKDWFLLPQEA